MKRTLLFCLLLLFLAAPCFGQSFSATSTALGNFPASGQVACQNTATLLYTTTQSGGTTPYGRLSITFQNQTAGVPVYIAPGSSGSCSSVTTGNAGILLTVQGHAVTLDRSSGNVTWCCITASGSATVGWTEER